MLTQLGLFFLSAATLVFEINLTRLYSVAQFYHFAFMIVSLALLGFGASGSALSLFPRWGRREPRRALGWLAVGFAFSSVGGFALTNLFPFDSFLVTWDRRQAGVLALHYLALATPFFCSGAAVGLLLSARPQTASRTYFVNLVGSDAGCLLALIASGPLGGEDIVLLSSALAALAAWLFWVEGGENRASPPSSGDSSRAAQRRREGIEGGPIPRTTSHKLAWGLPLALLLTLLTLSSLQPTFLSTRLSLYKDLNYALNTPGAKVVWQRWNAFSRIDVVESSTIRSLPGLSYLYPGLPPRQRGLTVDGGDLSPIVVDLDDLEFAAYIPGALAYRLRPSAHALLLQPHGGLDILVAHALGAQTTTAIEPNPLVIQAARAIYSLPGARTVVESGRSYARRADRRYDVVTLSLTAPYRPVSSGAYSLAENYAYTVEAFTDYLALLQPGGILQATRWMQLPPSEETRLFALAVTALERQAVRRGSRQGLDPANALVFFRGYNTATVLIRPDGFTPSELQAVRAWLAERAFDLVYAPDVRSDEVNHYNVLDAPDYYAAAVGLLSAPDRAAWYDAYPFDVSPPTDDHPFFGHYFKWRQAEQVWQEVGHTWQPFGGAGYFVLLALLALALAAALVLILLPLVVGRLLKEAPPGTEKTPPPKLESGVLASTLAYFGLIGLGFLLVEIPLAQRFILFLGQPVYGLTAVLFALLLFSGLGSWASARLPHRATLAALVAVVLAYPLLLPRLFDLFLGGALGLRLFISVAALAPLGFLLGVPFPRGVAWLEARGQGARLLIPWAWGVNGAASVVASAGAALLALSWGFARVLIVGALCYVGALVVLVFQARYVERG